ncbi:MAG: hypothetical protein ACM3OB_02930 [Acidobacteriota bacterium]
MTVQELNVLHQRYIDLSDRFRAAWTFHQFLQGLQKVFLESGPGKYPADFQTAYGVLKDISQNLNATEIDRIRGQLDGVEKQLSHLTASLLQEDSRISPSLLRQFFQRVKNYDEKILTQLVKFYIYSQRDPHWEPDRIDKVDYLLTKLGEEGPGSGAMRDRTRLREILRGLWAAVSGGPQLEAAAAERRGELERLRSEIAAVEDFDQLADLRLVRRYREFKHALGSLLFEPEMTLGILEINLLMKSKVRQLYAKEERRIFSESQRIFELEREVPLDAKLDEELASFRREMEKFESQLQQDNLRLEEVGSLRSQVKSLMPRLTGAAGKRDAPSPTALSSSPSPSGEVALLEELIATPLRRMITALEGSSPDEAPRAVSIQREVFPFRLEPREVVAFRRQHGHEPAGDGDLERFVLEGAALRVRLSEEAEEITGILDDTSITRDTPVFARARTTCRMADSVERRYSHWIDQAVLQGNFAEAQALQVLRMRMLREYAGLWLLANKR